MVRKRKIGYCAVTADFLHIGHIRFLKACKEKCKYLVVGIMTDECVRKYKGKKPMMSQEDRKEIIESLKFVGHAIYQNNFDFPMFSLHSDGPNEDLIIFDSEEHKRKGADVIIPRTKGISSSAFKSSDNCKQSL